MAITTRDGLVAALAGSQLIPWVKTAARTTVAAAWFSLFDVAGDPGAGTLAGTSTAAGVVPTDATAGCPVVNAFTGANTGYVARVAMSCSVACRMMLFDMLFKAGAYSFNASATLASQPSYSSRIPGGDYKGTQIWVECVTAFTGNMSIAVTYTNQDGTAARTTGTVATGVAPTLGRMIQLPLQAGDTGVQKIESVVGTVATVGTFNVLVLRPLAVARANVANDLKVQGPDLTGLPVVFTDSALVVAVADDSTSSGVPEMMVTIANG